MTKVNNFEVKIPDASPLIQANQHNADKQNLDNKSGDVENTCS